MGRGELETQCARRYNWHTRTHTHPIQKGNHHLTSLACAHNRRRLEMGLRCCLEIRNANINWQLGQHIHINLLPFGSLETPKSLYLKHQQEKEEHKEKRRWNNTVSWPIFMKIAPFQCSEIFVDKFYDGFFIFFPPTDSLSTKRLSRDTHIWSSINMPPSCFVSSKWFSLPKHKIKKKKKPWPKMKKKNSKLKQERNK